VVYIGRPQAIDFSNRFVQHILLLEATLFFKAIAILFKGKENMRFLSAAKALALFPLFCDLVLGAKGTSGTCSKDKKCDTGCCSKEGYCGFGPNFCGDDVCISNCDAQAECGSKFAIFKGCHLQPWKAESDH
jgi:hypothetical protein